MLVCVSGCVDAIVCTCEFVCCEDTRAQCVCLYFIDIQYVLVWCGYGYGWVLACVWVRGREVGDEMGGRGLMCVFVGACHCSACRFLHKHTHTIHKKVAFVLV